MDYKILLDAAVELGYQLAMSGAETYRIEECITRIFKAYGICAEVFAIPNCLHVSIEIPDQAPMTQMRRIGQHGNDLDSVERYSNLSRRICAEVPTPEIVFQLVADAKNNTRKYPLYFMLIGHFLGAFGFAILFGGNWIDAICGGICGIVIALINLIMDRLHANLFFKIISSSFIMAIVAYALDILRICPNVDSVIIGALMILVPGLIFTNAMRDIIYGDTNSGINRIVQVFLIAAAIALGTGAAWKVAVLLWGVPTASSPLSHPLLVDAIASFIGCVGFFICFNIYGPGGFLCALGGMLTWITYRLSYELCGNDIAAYFFATLTASVYSEVMARIRKYPATSYLVISAFPLIPGASVYYTMTYAVKGDMSNFAAQGIHTVAIAGAMAVGILLITTLVRMITVKISTRKDKSL